MATDPLLMRYLHDHQMSDPGERLDLTFFCRVVKGVAEALGRL